MKSYFKIVKTILWDFDGVIMDSMGIRDSGFSKVLESYPQEEVEKLLRFHRQNGGLSRYVKFRYFFEEIRGEKLSDNETIRLAAAFSDIMRQELLNRELLIPETMNFIKRNYNLYRMHVVSGSDQEELRYLCSRLGLSRFFGSIHGSPKPKTDIVKDLIADNSYEVSEVLLIGDSVNDQEAAQLNGINFAGFNNLALKEAGCDYIDSFSAHI